MQRNFTYLPYGDTGFFSGLVTDYLARHGNVQPFYSFSPDAAGIKQAIDARAQYPVDRTLLADTLAKQYAALPKSAVVERNLELLRKDTTYTVCTAHQPNLLTGYLYFLYKIIHAIKLAEELKAAYPEKDFVPVYYMGSEDNDLDELGVFNYGGKKYKWDGAGQTGAVGRMATKSLKPLLQELYKVLGPPGAYLDSLKELLDTAYLEHKTIGAATQYLVNELFGRYGLIVIDPDEAALKKQITDIIKDELLHQQSLPIVSAQIEKLEEHYKAQAHPRPINLFYLKDNIRERIEQKGDKWIVLNTNIEWTEQELMIEADAHPERFSPNVILRGLLQERILPNVAFIGGGAEVAYWLQLKPLFAHYKTFYPAILLRQSVQWIKKPQAQLREKAGIAIDDIFKVEDVLIREYISRNSNDDWQVSAEMAALEKIMEQLRSKAMALDVTLRSSAEAVLAKIKYQLQVLEKKMLRAEKRKMQTELERISRLKDGLFPGGSLQERKENFTGYFLQYGHSFLDILKDAMQPLKGEFLVVEEK